MCKYSNNTALVAVVGVLIFSIQTVFTSKVMTQQISTEQEEKTGHTQALVRCYGDSVKANRKLLEQAASSMEEPDIPTFIQVCKSGISELQKQKKGQKRQTGKIASSCHRNQS